MENGKKLGKSRVSGIGRAERAGFRRFLYVRARGIIFNFSCSFCSKEKKKGKKLGKSRVSRNIRKIRICSFPAHYLLSLPWERRMI